MMHMTLYWGKEVTLLFDSWKTDSWASYSITLLACFLFSIFYQYMEDRRLRFKSKSKSKSKSNPSSSLPSSIETPLLSKLGRSSVLNRLTSSVLFGFNSAIGYFLMLAIMSFNGGVFLASVLGLSSGYYFFRSGDGDDDDNNDDVMVVVENSCACS